MEKPRSSVAALTRSIQIPVVVAAAAAALLLLLRLLTDFVANATVQGAAAVLGATCVPLFIVVVADTNSRSAIDRANAQLERQWPSMSWRQRLVPEEADRLLLFLNRLLWVEATVAMFFDRPGFLLGLARLGLTTLLMFLELAYPRDPND